ncbi:ASCH domain-containing protein [Microbacterium aurantiacum]|uniref:ASCH domain-containing protein n=1 Tax=Microbacterium aurantiacum TaxID=162393 RepID=UPI000C7FC5C9|nr:ASCH domain-containing protein [Microbacterium aurantiacum]
MITASAEAVASFWAQARSQVPELPIDAPEAWAFGSTVAHADGLLELVLSGIKTGTASAVWDYEAAGDPMPTAGDLSIILDGAAVPRAVIRTTLARVVPFDEVDEAHAHAEGEGDRTLQAWREIHERYWRQHSENPHGFAPDMPVLCERFELVLSAS